ncbi:hypothetical protein FB45DRAFT_1038851 [Roridomyces roridus]|uniref:Uncharacterized protein n=1 Tax=Roridomyces roridus TaxID=1738132 RepID=A0AAD7FB26_9AGAR|nr:hypothetical protein FB45DRAFT_1038851 [Roridomyces roridus]
MCHRLLSSDWTALEEFSVHRGLDEPRLPPGREGHHLMSKQTVCPQRPSTTLATVLGLTFPSRSPDTAEDHCFPASALLSQVEALANAAMQSWKGGELPTSESSWSRPRRVLGLASSPAARTTSKLSLRQPHIDVLCLPAAPLGRPFWLRSTEEQRPPCFHRLPARGLAASDPLPSMVYLHWHRLQSWNPSFLISGWTASYHWCPSPGGWMEVILHVLLPAALSFVISTTVVNPPHFLDLDPRRSGLRLSFPWS